MLHVVVEAEIQRRIRVRGGDDVPARAPAAEMVERGEAAGDVIGLVEVVEAVAIRPMRSVTADSADSSVNGSNEVTVWLRLSALTGMFSTAR